MSSHSSSSASTTNCDSASHGGAQLPSRRSFLKMTLGGAVGLFLIDALGNISPVDAIPVPGGTLSPDSIKKFVTPLRQLTTMPTTGKANTYDIGLRQFVQQILPPGMPATTVWGYGARNKPSSFSYPACTIETTKGTPATVTWTNELMDAAGRFLPHLLPVDQTLHWANPPGGPLASDSRPIHTSDPGPYRGPVPMVTHLHGMTELPDWSDGYSESWFLPAAKNIPAGYATRGRWYDFFNKKSKLAWKPGSATYVYPNTSRPCTAWFHDHTLGMTRTNVYAGPVGFYLTRSTAAADNPKTRKGAAAVLPSGKYELPLAIQDRSFNTDGSLFYPSSREFFDGFTGPFLPDQSSDVSPIWNPEFFGNTMVVNGNTWPTLTVEPRRYRFRALNGCGSRFLVLKLDTNIPMWQVGTEGGFLSAPTQVTELLMAPAERADLIVDFTGLKKGTKVTLLNVGPDEPYGGPGFVPADATSTGLVMQFTVGTLSAKDTTTLPADLVLPAIAPLPNAVRTRSLSVVEMMTMLPDPTNPGATLDMPIGAQLGTFDMNTGSPTSHMWADPVTENPSVGDIENWEFVNLTADAHPLHVHDVFFQLISRQALDPVSNLPTGPLSAPLPTEKGWKDTVISYPGEVTRVRMKFSNAGQFTWHCHIVEHEDNEMMRPFRVGPTQVGEPPAMPNHVVIMNPPTP